MPKLDIERLEQQGLLTIDESLKIESIIGKDYVYHGQVKKSK